MFHSRNPRFFQDFPQIKKMPNREKNPLKIGPVAATLLLLGGCAQAPPAPTPWEISERANRQFLEQKRFDPWILISDDPQNPTPAYGAQGDVGGVIGADGTYQEIFVAGRYRNHRLEPVAQFTPDSRRDLSGISPYRQTLDLQSGRFQTQIGAQTQMLQLGGRSEKEWRKLWINSDIVISGDAEAQQVTHANLFYLLSSTFQNSTHSLPPMGLSSSAYNGRIFWDADVWMLPALIVQHPEEARSIVAYRFKTLNQAKNNARAHGFPGAEYAWESTDSGVETAPEEFARERHVTAGVAFAVWQYYLWTGDEEYLKREGWPILQASAQYWASRAKLESDGRFHIRGVLGPDETSGIVDDDAYTNAAARANLRWATRAAKVLDKKPDPRWNKVADRMAFAFDKKLGIIAEHQGMRANLRAKQADTLLLLHPLDEVFDAKTMGKMLDWYGAHTSDKGPAMTTAIHAVIAARLGRKEQSLQEFRASYRPFMRGPWAAFSEKPTTQNVYFLTGMGGTLQSVLYGFAGLQARPIEETGRGRRLIFDKHAALWADPHLPPGWKNLKIKGIRFRGHTLDLSIGAGDKITLQKR